MLEIGDAAADHINVIYDGKPIKSNKAFDKIGKGRHDSVKKRFDNKIFEREVI